MKTKLVVFTSNNARILINANPEEFPMAVVNPDLSAVKSTPPHFWKLDGDKIVPMSADERAARMDDIAKHGVDNAVPPVPRKPAPTPTLMERIPVEFWWTLAAATAYVAGRLT